MGFSVAAQNGMLDHFGTIATWASLHTADPGLTGANEVVGAPYERQPVRWNQALEGRMDSLNRQRFDLAANTTVTWVGLWTAEVGGTFLNGLDSADLTLVDAGGLIVSNIEVKRIDTVIPVPSTPVGLVGEATSANTIRATWTTPVANADDYELQIATTSDPDLFETGVLTTTSPYDFTGLAASTAYYIRILAHNNVSGFSAPSAVVGPVTTSAPPPVPPGDPSNLVATSASANQVDLTWTAGTNASSHNIHVSTTSATSGFSLLETGWPTLVYPHTGRCPLTQYWYRVRAKNDVGLSPNFSAVDDATTLAGAPPAVIDLAPGVVGSNYINIDWGAVCSATEYEVRRSNTGAAGTYAEIATTSGTTYLDTPLAPSVRRFYRVRAVLVSGVTRFTSADSNTISAQTSSSSVSPCTTTDTLIGPTDGPLNQIINARSSNVAKSWCLAANDNGSLATYNINDFIYPPSGSTIKGEREPDLGTISWRGNMPADREPRYPETWYIKITSPTMTTRGIIDCNSSSQPPGHSSDVTVENIWVDGRNFGIPKGVHWLDGNSVLRRVWMNGFRGNGTENFSGRVIDCRYSECGDVTIKGPTTSGQAAASKILTGSDTIYDHCFVEMCQRDMFWYDCHVMDESKRELLLNRVLNCWFDGTYPLHDTPKTPVENNLFALHWEISSGPAEFAYNHMQDTGHFPVRVSGARNLDVHHNEFVNCSQNLSKRWAIVVKDDGRVPVIQPGEWRTAGQPYCGPTSPSYEVVNIRFHHNTLNNHWIKVEENAGQTITASTDPASGADFVYHDNTGLGGFQRN